jgi:hypothetical protein
MPVQLRYETGLTGADYVTGELWRLATLRHCPLHPRGGCGLARHGTYERKTPPGTHVARWYCPQGHRTFSLLPDHLAARFPGTLAEIEQVALAAETARGLEACADALRADSVSLPSALRWVWRRVRPVRLLLRVAVGLLPRHLLGVTPTIAALRERLGCGSVLLRLREMLAAHLAVLAFPVGFGHRGGTGGRCDIGFQQHLGRDPPERTP